MEQKLAQLSGSPLDVQLVEKLVRLSGRALENLLGKQSDLVLGKELD